MLQRNKVPQPGGLAIIEDKPGVRCDFETECAWTWNVSMADNFKVVTVATLNAINKTERISGPITDLKGTYQTNTKFSTSIYLYKMFSINIHSKWHANSIWKLGSNHI